MKYHTVILVPHARARFRKWRVSNRQLVIGACIVGLLTTLSIVSTWTFFTRTVDLAELDQVRSENVALREVNRSFETSIRNLKKELSDFEDRTRQLAIVAGLEQIPPGQEAGIGGDADLLPIANTGQDLASLQERSTLLTASLEEVDGRLTERLRLIASTPAIAPVKGILTSAYGRRRDPVTGKPALHTAIDIATSPGREVLASADGIVLRAERVGGLGKAVYISHGFGITTRYGHLSKLSVVPGQRVRRFEPIGRVGRTGRATGYHLHYEVRVDGKPVNPLAYILDSTSS